MTECHSRYAYTETDDCAAHHSASIFYFVSTVAAMMIIGTATLLFFCCIYCKRRRIAERLRSAEQSGTAPVATPPVVYVVWPGTTSTDAAGPSPSPILQATVPALHRDLISKSADLGTEGDQPVSCVIMAGDERPTHLATPLPRSSEDLVKLHARRTRKADHEESLVTGLSD